MELSTGEAPLDPATLLFPVTSESEITHKSVQELLKRQTEILKRARAQLIAARELVAKRVNEKRVAPRFYPGAKVWLKTKHLTWPGVDLLGKHLKPPKIGPFEVIRLNSSKTAVELKFDFGTKVHPVQPVSRCELYVPDTRNRSSRVNKPQTFDEQGDETGEIERIVGKKVRRGRTFYQVKWKGFDPKFNTWESAQHLANEGCQESIDDFESALSVLLSLVEHH